MGKLNIFEITLENPTGVYYPAQPLTGHITVELTDSMKMRGIRLEFNGRASVKWTETHTTGSGENRRTETRNYTAHEKYVDSTLLMFGNLNGRDTISLPIGRHTFPFQFLLPPQLPSSFEGQYGNVRYMVKGVIDKPWKFDHTCKKPFTLISMLDLNLDPQAAMPQMNQKQKTLCCLCCASGPISVVFRLDRTGYVPGDAIEINAEIINLSNRKISSSKAKFKMEVTFHASGSTRSQHQQIVALQHGEIASGDSDIWRGEKLLIPPLPPSYLVGCRIINIRYVLELSVDPSGPSIDLNVPLEVIIGTVPLRSVVGRWFPHLLDSEDSQPYSVSSEILPDPSSYEPCLQPLNRSTLTPTASPNRFLPNLPPPTYQESMFGKVDVRDENDSEHTRGQLDYVPVYTYYNWGGNSSYFNTQYGSIDRPQY